MCNMQFTSTRCRMELESAKVITQGISNDGGLFVPLSFPQITEEMIDRMVGMSYKERAKTVLSLYLTDFTDDEITRCVEGAYTGTFENEEPAPMPEVKKGMNLLELWHGPT